MRWRWLWSSSSSVRFSREGFVSVSAEELSSDDPADDGAEDGNTEEDGEGQPHPRPTPLPSAYRLPLLLLLVAVLSSLGASLLLLSLSPSDASSASSLLGLSTPPSSPYALSAGEREAVLALTGQFVDVDGASTAPSTSGRLSPSSILRLRAHLRSIAATLLHLRPALYLHKWAADCQSFIPCPTPTSSLRRTHPNLSSDLPVYQSWLHTEPWSTAWARSAYQPPTLPPTLSTPPTSDPAVELLFSPPTPSTPWKLLGESADSTALPHRFQADVWALQYPSDCASAPLLVMDWWHVLGGFGSYQHARVIPHMFAMRMGRTLVEAVGLSEDWAYGQAWNNCTRERGLGGCEVFLSKSNCTLPPDWRQQAQVEREAHAATRGPLPDLSRGGWAARARYLQGRRWVLYSEVMTSENTNMLHRPTPLWTRQEMRDELSPSLAYLSPLPACWWNAQLLAYQMRTTPPALQRAALLVAQTLRLPQPEQSARIALTYAHHRQPNHHHTVHTQLVWQALKLAWQVAHTHHGQQLIERMRAELRSAPSRTPSDPAEVTPDSRSATSPTPSPVALLGYSFIRHGDKATEAALVGEDAYLLGMQRQARLFGLSTWYVGSDDLLSIDVLLSANANSSQPLLFYSSPLVAAIPDRAHHPFAGGFVWKVSLALGDEEREALFWRTLLEALVGCMADVHLSTWSSNHPRAVYEMATAPSEARATMPFQSLDDYINMNLDMKREVMPEQCR